MLMSREVERSPASCEFGLGVGFRGNASGSRAMRNRSLIACVYAREDAESFGRLETILNSLERRGLVAAPWVSIVYTESESNDGTRESLQSADLVIPLLSPSLLSSGFCSTSAMGFALARHDAGLARVLPVVAASCAWEATPLGRVVTLPRGGGALARFTEGDEDWVQVEAAIAEAAESPGLSSLYGRLCREGRAALASGRVDELPYVNDLGADGRLGLTLVAHPSDAVASRMLAATEELRRSCPGHFYYDKERLHFTLLPLVAATDPPKVSDALARRFAEPILDVLRESGPFEVEFEGVCATSSSLIVKGYPVGDGLATLRNRLRERLAGSGLADQVEERYRSVGAHVTLARLIRTGETVRLLEAVSVMEDRALGSMLVEETRLVVNDFYMSPDKVRAVAECRIGAPDADRTAADFQKRDDRTPGPQVRAPTRVASGSSRVEPAIGIITALPKELAAAKRILEDAQPYHVPGKGAGRRYWAGRIPALGGRFHTVVLGKAEMGTNPAATRATLMLEHFPTIQFIIMVGIAGGCPHPGKPSEHVRLGDVVVSDERGVIQYDYVRKEAERTVHRPPPRPPSAALLEAAKYLEADDLDGSRPWLEIGDAILSEMGIKRPPSGTDRLAATPPAEGTVRHPRDPRRKLRWPRVFLGAIGSANTLLKDPVKRDFLRDEFGVKAVEMEGSGIADATWNHEAGFLIVRGICDYCDKKKGDAWQAYAAVVAAAYARALLESIPAPAAPTAHNLPMIPSGVVGREAEYEQALRLLGDADEPVVLATGYGGIGKSTLAKKTAWACADLGDRFDLIAWVDLRQYGEAKHLTLDYVLDTIARTADASSDIPRIGDREAKAARVRDLLAGRRSLIILDNYESLLSDHQEESRVSTFLGSLSAVSANSTNGTRIRVLITTREVSRGLRALPSNELKLESMSLDDAMTLMKARSGAAVTLSDAQYTRVWRLLCGLPKYLEIAIDQLKNLDFEQWVALVVDIDAPLDDRGAFFSDLFGHSWERFPPEIKKVLLALTFFVGEAPPEALRATCGLSKSDFARTLAEASDAYIEYTGSGYTAHPLTHAYCWAVLAGDVELADFGVAAGRRFVRFYAAMVEGAGASGNAGLVVDDIRNVVAAARLARKLEAWHDLGEIRAPIADLVRFRGYWRELADIMEQAAAGFREIGDERLLATCLVNDLVWYSLRLEDTEAADRYAREGVSLFRKLEDMEGVALGTRHLGKSALLQGLDPWYEPDQSWPEHAAEAERRYLESLRIRIQLERKGVDQQTPVADMKLDLGRLHWLNGKWLERDGRVRGDPASVESALNEYGEARSVTSEAMLAFEELGDLRGIAKAWGNLGNATKEMAKHFLADRHQREAAEHIALAHDHYECSLKLAEKIDRRDEIAHAKWGLAEVYEIYADNPGLYNRWADPEVLLEIACGHASDSARGYLLLGGGRDIRATGRLESRLRGRLLLV